MTMVMAPAPTRIDDTPVSRIALVSPERSRQIEGILVRMAQTGQLRGKVSEEQLIELLEQVSTCTEHHSAPRPLVSLLTPRVC